MAKDGAGEMISFQVPEYKGVYEAVPEKIARGFRVETTASKIRHSENERPRGLRVKRAEIYRKFLKTKDRDERIKLTNEGKEYDRLNDQLMTKQQISVIVEGCGVQTSSFCVLDSNPEHKKTKPPIFLWTGISNDPEGIGWLGIMMAKMTDRQVVVVGHPNGWDGDCTKEYGDAIRDEGVRPAVDYFIGATEKIAAEMGIKEYALTGMSTGANLAAEAIKRDGFAGYVTEVGLVATAGCANINETVAKIMDGLSMFPDTIKLKLPYLNSVNLHEVEMPQEKRERMLNAHRPLAAIMLSRTEWWKDLKETGKKITAVVFKNDNMTKGVSIKEELRREIDVILLKGSHSTPMIHPEKTIEALFS